MRNDQHKGCCQKIVLSPYAWSLKQKLIVYSKNCDYVPLIGDNPQNYFGRHFSIKCVLHELNVSKYYM